MLLVTISTTSSGCFFFLPFDEIPVNEPPTITEGYPAIGETIVISQAQVSVVAIVRDQDDLENLYHRWTISNAGLQTNWYITDGVGANAVANTLMVDNNEAYDGKTLSLVVEDPSGAFARAEWTLQVNGSTQ
jgi:hypothetical protein